MDNHEIQTFSQQPHINRQQPLKSIWAIDPYDDEHYPHLDSISEIRSFLGGSFQNTIPVFISGPQDLGLFSVNEKIQEFLKNYPVGHLPDAKVIRTESADKKVWVAELLKVAQVEGAEALILSSHGKRGLSKLLVGSFAEDLLEVSPYPIFFLSSEPQKRSNHVLFATDFSDDSKVSFFELMKLISGTDKELILFHAISLPVTSIGVPHFGGEIGPSFGGPYWLEQSKWAEEESAHWMKEAQQLGFKIRFHSVVEEALSQPGPAVLHFAESENVELIALASHGRKKGQFFFGSVTYDVLASKKFNVWACGPRFYSEHQH